MNVLKTARRAWAKWREEGASSVLARATMSILPGRLCFGASRRRLLERQEETEALEDVLDTAYEYRGWGPFYSIRPSQVRQEIAELLRFVRGDEPEVVMEIGTKLGGTLYLWCRCLTSLELVLSLDLPGGEFGGGYSAWQRRFFESFLREGVALKCIRRDSHDPRTVERVERELDGREVDFLFVDGDHTYEGVRRDFEMYAPLVREGGLVAFHDIVEHREDPRCEVDEFWHEVKQRYPAREFVADREQGWAGIGVVRV